MKVVFYLNLSMSITVLELSHTHAHRDPLANFTPVHPKVTVHKSQVCVTKQFKPYPTANAFSNSTDCAM